ncbi:MAG: CDP-alcohol phosphatidyltransferase family protein [Acidobacteria bacterium]|nr:CDP-alcohol phosphatidyltransferase family protein [Acidobacteriota bacterium]
MIGIETASEQKAPARISERRLQESILAAGERRLLIWIARRVPTSINSDHLTILGFAAQLVTGLSYVLCRLNSRWLFVAVASLLLNWLGDSLDGTLARVRQQMRPRYGFYVDHILDSFGAVAVMAGLAVSGYMSPAVATMLLVVFLLLSIQSYLAVYALGEFRLSFWRCGPTEIRLALAIGNFALFRWPTVSAMHYRLFDVGGTIAVAIMSAMLVYFTGKNVSRLYQLEPLP